MVGQANELRIDGAESGKEGREEKSAAASIRVELSRAQGDIDLKD